MNDINLVNLPPWAQTTLTLVGLASLATPVVLRVLGLQNRPWAIRVIAITNDIVGAKKGGSDAVEK